MGLAADLITPRHGIAPVTAPHFSDSEKKLISNGDALMADYKRGSMDISRQEKTFAGFVRMVAWGGGIVIALLVLLALANG